MIFDVPFLIEYFSSFMTLQPGRPDPDRHARWRGRLPGRRRGRHRDRGPRRAHEHHRRRRDFGAERHERRMRIDHLIDGKPVAGRDYFETVNPATQEVLAEVAVGRRSRGQRRRRRREGGLPAMGRAAGAAARQADAQAGRPDRRSTCPSWRAPRPTTRGQVIAQTGKQLVPRAADNFYYFAEMCTRVDGHTYPTETHLNYTLFHPVGVCALISPWNVPFMTATWKVAPCLAFGNTAVLKMSELSPHDGRAAGRAGAGGRAFRRACSTWCTATARKRASRWCGTPTCARSRSPARTATGNRIVQASRAEEVQHGAGRQDARS